MQAIADNLLLLCIKANYQTILAFNTCKNIIISCSGQSLIGDMLCISTSFWVLTHLILHPKAGQKILKPAF